MEGAEGWSLFWRDGSNGALGVNSEAVLQKQGDWERRMESADRQQAELSHFQWGLIRDQVATLAREMAGIRGDVDGLVRDQRHLKEDMERKATGSRDLILQERQARETNHSTVSGWLTVLEQKLQQELFKISSEHRARHSELRDHSCGLADQLKELHGIQEVAIADVRGRHSENDAALRELLAELDGKHGKMRTSVAERLEAAHELQRAEAERMHGASGALVDVLRSEHSSLIEAERTERNALHSTLQDRLGAIERQLSREGTGQPKAMLVRQQPPQIVSAPLRVETSPVRQRASSASPLATFSAAPMQPVLSPPAGLLPFRSGPGVFSLPLRQTRAPSSFATSSPLHSTLLTPGPEDPHTSEAGPVFR